MKTVLALVAALLLGVPGTSQAQRFYVGAEAGFAVYPDFTEDVARAVVAAGATSAEVKQDASGLALGAFAGVWIIDNLGVEAAYTDLGSVEGKVTTTPPSNTFYEYSASAASVAVLGAIRVGRGKIYGKGGAHKTEVEFKSPTQKVSTSSNGLLVGGGYWHEFGRRLIVKGEIAVYSGVKFQTFNAPAGTSTTDNIIKVTAGVAYGF